ncbi:hypothetical protein EXIGLDRAFT_765966 [Exidia glandulosa HHB12029]|uniref:Uncharacterized protein n=1 Tax=Exidia glandulosa HHB12029 TaxID=1314781 RepID=A0A166AWF5_EXIGL|nr:hypothetical protein EXIGLDRAFT_765966 [Exidia glandulosa HHB12029]
MPGLTSFLFSRKKVSDSKAKAKNEESKSSYLKRSKRFGMAECLEIVAANQSLRVIAPLTAELHGIFHAMCDDEDRLYKSAPFFDVHQIEALQDMLTTRLVRMQNIMQQIESAGGTPDGAIVDACERKTRFVGALAVVIIIRKEKEENAKKQVAEREEQQKMRDSQLYRVDILPPRHVQQDLSYEQMRAHLRTCGYGAAN